MQVLRGMAGTVFLKLVPVILLVLLETLAVFLLVLADALDVGLLICPVVGLVLGQVVAVGILVGGQVATEDLLIHLTTFAGFSRPRVIAFAKLIEPVLVIHDVA